MKNNRVQFKNSLRREQDKKIETILLSLAALVGIVDGTLSIIVAFNNKFPYEHPIIFWIGLSSLFIILISGFILSCIREYRYDAKKFKNTMRKIGIIIISSVALTALLFALMLYSIIYK